MNPTDFPQTPREKYLADQARAELLKEERLLRESQQGFFRTQLPMLVYCTFGLSWIYAAGVFVVLPMRDANQLRFDQEKNQSEERPYYEANAAYNNGDFEKAAGLLKPQLEKNPQFSHGQILMAKIQFAKGNKDAAIQHLKNAREYTLDFTEIDHWIARLDGSSPDESKESTSPNLSGKSSPSK